MTYICKSCLDKIKSDKSSKYIVQTEAMDGNDEEEQYCKVFFPTRYWVASVQLKLSQIHHLNYNLSDFKCFLFIIILGLSKKRLISKVKKVRRNKETTKKQQKKQIDRLKDRHNKNKHANR